MMAQKRSQARSVKVQARSGGTVRWMVVIGVILLAASPSLHRNWWRWGERSTSGAAVEALRSHGCLVCHPRSAFGYRWRSDGTPPENSAVIKDALKRGRPAVPGMPGPMPAYGERVGKAVLDRLGSGAEIAAGITGWDEEPEVRIGLTIGGEMGCFDCHGPLGAGGMPNPGSLGGLVPGFFGASFVHASQSMDGVEGIIRGGRPAKRAWWTPWKRPALDMPAFGDRLDSTETALVAHAIRSVSEWDDD